MRILKNILAISALAVASFAPSGAVQAQEQRAAADPYTLCSFYPQAAACEAVYQEALKDDSRPSSRSIRDAFNLYARYLKNPGALTDQDRAWLASNAISLPADLGEADLGGLHNVINDPALTKDATLHTNAVKNFISRAVEAEIFCGLNICGESRLNGTSGA